MDGWMDGDGDGLRWRLDSEGDGMEEQGIVATSK
jgi:hypothetical protein